MAERVRCFYCGAGIMANAGRWVSEEREPAACPRSPDGAHARQVVRR